MKTITLLIINLLLFSIALFAQVGINTGNNGPDGSAILDVNSTDKGFLPPRLTEAQRNGISNPAAGLLIFQTDGTTGFYYYNGTNWIGNIRVQGQEQFQTLLVLIMTAMPTRLLP